MKKRGQVSLSYIILFALIIFAIVPLLYFSASTSSQTSRTQKAHDVVSILSVTANAVHNLGSGNKETVFVNMPSGVKNYSITGKEIKLIMEDGTEVKGEAAISLPGVIGKIPIVQGSYYIPVISLNETLIVIGNVPFLIKIVPDCIGMNQMNPDGLNITVHGIGLQPTTDLYVRWPNANGALLAQISPSNVYYENPNLMKFLATTTNFFANPVGDPFKIYAALPDGELSNDILFDVMPGFGTLC